MQITTFFRSLFVADPGQQPASNSGWINDALQHQCSVAQTRRFESLQTAKRLLETSETPDWAHSWSTSAAHINEDLRGTLPTIVARATNLARNNEWAQRWLIQQRDNVLGQTGINIMTRLMGLILAALAVELLADGLTKLFPVLASHLAR
jgi:capsid protein